MRIAVLSHVRHPIARPFMGGMEAHSWHLCRGLAARGHEVVLFAAGGSEAGVALHPVLPAPYEARYPWADHAGSEVLTAHLDAGYGGALGALGTFDVVHNNSLHRYPPRWARRERVPMVTSLHVPPFEVLARAVSGAQAPWARFTVTSQVQRRRWWDEAPDEAHVVPNGIDPALWPVSGSGDGSAVWAGRLMANKGAHLAIDAARMAGVALTLYGAMEDSGYFAAEVAPRLGGDIRYGGHLDAQDLAAAFGRASVCLFTPLWDEPFGLAAVEAMACGLPVAGFEAGAVREVVGDCGALAVPGDVAGLAEAISRAMAVPRTAPRARVEARFTLSRMIATYEDLYARAIAGRASPAREVRYAPWELPEAVA